MIADVQVRHARITHIELTTSNNKIDVKWKIRQKKLSLSLRKLVVTINRPRKNWRYFVCVCVGNRECTYLDFIESDATAYVQKTQIVHSLI